MIPLCNVVSTYEIKKSFGFSAKLGEDLSGLILLESLGADLDSEIRGQKGTYVRVRG